MNGMGGACRFFIFIYFLIPGDVVFVRVMDFRTDISRIPDFTHIPRTSTTSALPSSRDKASLTFVNLYPRSLS